MRIATRLTERLAIEHPVICAPMGFIAGGRLAAAVTNAGGLGLIGGGYGDAAWLEQQFAAAGNARVGCGFITWSLATKPDLLDLVLSHRPAALMLSFGDPRPFAGAIRASGAALICQIQSLAHARQALEAGAEIIVAQGREAGGHGGSRSTLPLVAEVADLLTREAPDTLLVAAGGIAEGRALAAALALGADGVLVGSRFMASAEALTPDAFQPAILAADGDSTVKTTVIDIVRRFDWPSEFDARALATRFVTTWHGRESELTEADINAEANRRFWQAFHAGDAENAGVFMGEGVGLIRDVVPAGQIIERMVAEASARLAAVNRMVVP